MQRLSTTVVAVIGAESGACVSALDDARNVAALRVEGDEPDIRAMDAWKKCVRSRALYTIHDADPLKSVADAWAASFTGGPRGDLEIAAAETRARWRAESIGLPDFYLVLAPEELPAGIRDWYLGVLHRAAPHRVVPVASEATMVRHTMASLGSGRWWPTLDEMLDGLETQLPDQLMANADSDPSTSDHRLLL